MALLGSFLLINLIIFEVGGIIDWTGEVVR